MGKKSFSDMRTVNNIEYATYREACEQLGLLQDDREWEWVLQEAHGTRLWSEIRNLFVVILCFCNPQNPKKLLADHWKEWMGDFQVRFQQATEDQLKNMVLLDLEMKLQASGKDLSLFEFYVPTDADRDEIMVLRNETEQDLQKVSVVMQEELNFNYEKTMTDAEQRQAVLKDSQRSIFDQVVDAVKTGNQELFFIDARGGTGKTFLLNAILQTTRTLNGKKNVSLGVASSGIAATLLDLGRTVYSRFKAPLEHNATEVFNIKATDNLAELIREANIIVWDEAPMMHRHHLEGLDRTLRDIMGNDFVFGGKCLVLAGDFRQCLPVIPRGSRAQITNACLKKSPLWKYFEVRTLTDNLRIKTEGLKKFDNYLLDMGNGNISAISPPDWIKITHGAIQKIDSSSNSTIETSMDQFVETIFPQLHHQMDKPLNLWIPWIAERAILAPKNYQVDLINKRIVDSIKGNTMTCISADSTDVAEDSVRFPVEFLNTLTPAGMPPNELHLKKGIVLMLLRNLNPRQGLCNGTRLILEEKSGFLLKCHIATGSNSGQQTLIPRIDLTTAEREGAPNSPVKWRRRQYPVRPAFAMSINKAQGQTLKKVGIWLFDQCFSHGQLYVASSRVGDPQHLVYGIRDKEHECVENIVYKEVL